VAVRKFFSPLANKLARQAFGEVPLTCVAAKAELVAPGCVQKSGRAIYLEDDLTRITGVSHHSRREWELQRIGPRVMNRKPTVAYTLRDLVFAGGNFFKGRFKYSVLGGGKPWVTAFAGESLLGGVLCDSHHGMMYFGHWLTDDVLLKHTAAALGRPVGIGRRLTPHQHEYTKLLGLRQDALVCPARIQELVVIETDVTGQYQAEGWRRVHDELSRHFNHAPHPGVMIVRGNSGVNRLLLNEREVAAHLVQRKFVIIDPQSMSVHEMLGRCWNARVVVGVEGSHLSHGFHALAPGGTMLVLQPPYQFNNIFKDLCDCKGARYAFSIGHAAPGGFRIDLNSLDRVLDRIERDTA
jgi:hypothetical protein